ncbi:DUF2971 domain-containing protein [Snodgrassella alvi]|uniref:tetratricopeptide repeat protein n=1 Tax=Snodgrassella alvi TaxID=1196083 RepID=UPI0035B4686C
MEEKDIDQQIEELNKITREDGKETYAQAQFNLACIYHKIKQDDKAEAFYLNINKEDNPVTYAEAQFKLGYIYEEIKHDYDQAEAFYLNINKEDNPELYALAQFSLGYIYQEIKHDYDQAEAFYLNINKEDNPLTYAEVQFKLGYIYEEIKHDYDQAEAFYLNINKEDNPELYALAQFSLGYIYEEIKHDYDQTEAFYLNINKEDNPELYALAQFSLGYIYQEIKHDYDQAEAFYLNINKEDNPERYAVAQFSLGNIYFIIKQDYDKAKTYFSNITKENNPELYANAQFNLGCCYYRKHNYSNAKTCYLNVSVKDSPNAYIQAKFELGKMYISKIFKNFTKAQSCFFEAAKTATYSNCHPYYYICAQFILKLKQNDSSFISNKNKFAKINKIIFARIKKICDLANNIKNTLLAFNQLDNNKHIEKKPERRVAHYTKPAVLFNLLKGKKPSKFRLNIVDFMNDPSENQVLTSWLNISNNPDNEIKSFLASFSFNHNSLNQFRLYGNEDNIVGSGVSIAFNKNFFGLDTERSINNEIISLHSIKSIKSFENKQVKLETEQIEIKNDNTLYPLPLYRCLYFDPKTGYMALAKRNKQSFYLENKNEKTPETIDREWDDYINLLNESDKISKIRTKLEAIQKLIAELSNNPELKKISNLDELLSLAVLPISCLIKHAAFEDEDECRMIYITHIADDNIVEPQDYQSANSLYVEYTHVEEYIDNIYLGPQCKMQHKIWLQNHFKKKRREREIKLIKSEMPLR